VKRGPETHDDQSIWDMVAFVRNLAGMSEQYGAVVEREEIGEGEKPAAQSGHHGSAGNVDSDEH
jgi:hypothetical protein